MKAKLGDKVRDTVTGYEGVITGVVDYLTGCRQCLLTAKVKKDGTIPEGRWFDIDRLQVLKAKAISIEVDTNGFDLAPPVK